MQRETIKTHHETKCSIFLCAYEYVHLHFFVQQGLDHGSNGLNLVSNIIREHLGIEEISVLMGANLAKEVAQEMFGEATIGNMCGINTCVQWYALVEKLNTSWFYQLKVDKVIDPFNSDHSHLWKCTGSSAL